MDQEQILQYGAIIGIIINILSLIAYLLQAWWLYLINKKLWEEYPWIAFIPVIQIYSFVKAAGKEPIWILWIILWTLLFVIPWLIICIMLTHEISKRCWRWAWTTILFILFPYIMFPIVWNSMPDLSSQKLNTASNLDL